MKLLQHQIEAIRHLNEWRVGALFMEAGTGKTRVACELVNAVPNIDMVLWCGPLGTIRPTDGTAVRDEIEKWGGLRCPYVRFVGVESIGQSGRIYMDVRNDVEQHDNVFMVVDESIKIKNDRTKRFQRLNSIGLLTQYRLILNGTPLTRNIMDLWAQMEFLSPKILNMSWTKYKNTFCTYKTITKRRGGYKMWSRDVITGYENIDYLYSLIRHYVYQCDLKLSIGKNYHEVYYHVDMDSRGRYEEIKTRYLEEEAMDAWNNNVFLAMTNEMQHAYCITPSKFAKVQELFDNGMEQEKTIIFCRYIVSRQECQKRFPNAKVLSYQTDALGLNLQAYNNTIYFDKIWDYALRVQSGHRTYRTGQNLDCQYYDLTGDVKLENLIEQNISKKIGMAEYFKMKTKEQIKEEL